MRLAALLIVVSALPAYAQSSTSTSTSPAPSATPAATTPAPATTSSSDAAREHYEKGLAKYNLADFDAAIVEFKQSYELSKAPRLLFNIAQAYRLKKDYESALYFYNTYLRADPNPSNLDDVDAKIDEMKRAIDEQKKRAAKAQREQTPPPPPKPIDRGPSKRTLRIAGLTVGALGVACLGVGGGMLGLAAADGSKLHKVAVNNWPWNAADDAIYREGSSAQTAGIVLLSAGGALVVAGGITLIAAARR